MKTQNNLKKIIIILIFLSAPLLNPTLFKISPLPFLDMLNPINSLLYPSDPLKAQPFLHALSNNYVDGQGTDLPYQAVANVTSSTSKITDIPAFFISTNVWNITFTSLNISNLNAYAKNQIFENNSNNQIDADNGELFARRITVENSCVLNNFSIYRSALANNTLQLINGSTANVDYGPINITITIWNATLGTYFFKPHKILKTYNFNNRLYGWAMNGSPNHIEYPEIGWETFNMSNFYLNTENTQANNFFISINATKHNNTYDSKPISSFYKWYYQTYTVLPTGYNTCNSTDNGTSWGLPFPITPFYSMTIGMNTSLLTNSFYPSNISLNIEGVAVNDTATKNQGLWSSSNYYPYLGSNFKQYSVSSNWSALSFDVYFNCLMNKSGIISSYYLANGSKDYVDWNSTLNYDLLYSNPNNTIYITFPTSWNSTSTDPPLNSRNYTQGSNKILEIYNATMGNLEIYFRSRNFINKISIEQYKAGTFYQEIGFSVNITETIRINATFIDTVISNLGTLSIYDFNQILNFTDQKSPTYNILSFSNWDIDSNTKSNGTYLIQVFWTNGTAVGLNYSNLYVTYPTLSSVLSPTITQIFYRQPINITIYFMNTYSENIYGETGIKRANITAIFNDTSTKYTLSESANPGYYYTNINTTDFENGTYNLNISVQKLGYLNWTFNLLITIVYNTSFSVNTTTLTIYYSQIFDIEINFNRTDTNTGINLSVIQILINGTEANITIDTTEQNAGNYTLHFNTTNLLLPEFNIIIIKISKQGYYQRQTNINVTILKALTTLENFTISKRQGGLEVFNITVFYNNTILNRGIDGANLSIYKDGRPIIGVYNTHSAVNNDTFGIYDFENGTYNIELNVTIGKNYTMQILIISNESGYINGTKTIYQEIWVWAAYIPSFSFSNPVTYGKNQTIILQYNLTNGTGISNANVFSTWNDIGYFDEFLTDYSNGTYSLTFNTNMTMAGNQSILVNTRKNGYEWNDTLVNFRIAGYITNSTTINSSFLIIYVNDSISNIRVRYYNVSDNYNVSNANVLFQLKNSSNYLFDTENTSIHILYKNETNGEYNFTINTKNLHADIYKLNITTEFHNISIAFEYSIISFVINITRLPSNLTTILHTGVWWQNQNNSLRWFESENISININFEANFYDTGVPIEGNVNWGNVYYEIIKKLDNNTVLQGQFLNLGSGIYQTTINLSMAVQSKTSEDYTLRLKGEAIDIQNATLEIDLSVIAKKDISIIFFQLPDEIVENDIILIQALILDGQGLPASGETVIFNIHILTTSGALHTLRIQTISVGGIALLYFQVPYNVQGITIEASTERSMASWASNSFYQPVKTLPSIYNVVRFFKISWPIIIGIAVASVLTYYYQRKYKPKKVKQKEVRDTISYRFKSAANLVHILVYDQKTSELLYVYSSPGEKLSSYVMNSILESISMYDDMKVTREEIYLLDDARLILHDGEYVRIAMITKELPSVEMEKQLEQYIEEFELKFGKLIPEWREDISRLARMIDMGFANELIEKCFEKSLIFPHDVVISKEEVKLTSLEEKLLETAKKIRSKAGPFLLQRLIARGQTELSANYTLLQILEAVYNMRKKKVLVPVSEKEAERLKEETYKKGKEEKGPKKKGKEEKEAKDK